MTSELTGLDLLWRFGVWGELGCLCVLYMCVCEGTVSVFVRMDRDGGVDRVAEQRMGECKLGW